jgi:hypothetical protein
MAVDRGQIERGLGELLCPNLAERYHCTRLRIKTTGAALSFVRLKSRGRPM